MALAALLAMAAGCGGGLDPPSLVTKLRVLAVRAEPPEVHPGDTMALDALVVGTNSQIDGGSDADALTYLWIACLPPPGSNDVDDCAAAAAAQMTRTIPACTDDPHAPVCLLGRTPTVSYQPAPEAAAGNVFIAMVVATPAADGAVGCIVRVAGPPPMASGDGCVISLKTVSVHAPDGARLNQNPAVGTFLVQGVQGMVDVHQTPPVQLPVTQKVTLKPVYDPATAETKPDDTREVLTFSWFSTRKDFDHFHSGFDPKNPGERDDNSWSDQAQVPGLVDFWLVVRDDRGGVGWTSGQLDLQAP